MGNSDYFPMVKKHGETINYKLEKHDKNPKIQIKSQNECETTKVAICTLIWGSDPCRKTQMTRDTSSFSNFV